jgi:topoisomerase-4 subunit A
LQKYRDGQISDAKVFVMKQGLSWIDSAGREHIETGLRDWRGERAQAGRLAPRGFSRSNRFV